MCNQLVTHGIRSDLCAHHSAVLFSPLVASVACGMESFPKQRAGMRSNSDGRESELEGTLSPRIRLFFQQSTLFPILDKSGGTHPELR